MKQPSLYMVLQFPDRAENLGQYSEYEVDLEHWKPLSETFMRRFEAVYERGSSAVLLVHGPQGSGKTLFGLRLAADYQAQLHASVSDPRADNLWHVLIGGERPDSERIREASARALVRPVGSKHGWLTSEREFAANDEKSAVRIFLFDDALKDSFLSEWVGLPITDWLKLKVEDKSHVLLDTIAEKIVEAARGDFRRSIFVMLSNDASRLDALHAAIERVHRGLSVRLELPLPQPRSKERIIRVNTNRLNKVSYWYCLDTARKEERTDLHNILMAEQGFTDSFHAVDTALKRRTGRPANRNLLTLITLGSSPAEVRAFLQDKELLGDGDSSVKSEFEGEHLGAWFAFEAWAEAFARGRDAELSRRAKMLQSEFSLRWVALDVRATWHLLQEPGSSTLGDRVSEMLSFVPSVAKSKPAAHQKFCMAVEGELANAPEPDGFEQRFRELKRDRSSIYEPLLARRYTDYSSAVPGYSRLKPDHTAQAYTVCAITAASSNTDAAISAALKRTGHFLEFTSYLGPDLAGIDEYIASKIDVYARMLESL